MTFSQFFIIKFNSIIIDELGSLICITDISGENDVFTKSSCMHNKSTADDNFTKERNKKDFELVPTYKGTTGDNFTKDRNK